MPILRISILFTLNLIDASIQRRPLDNGQLIGERCRHASLTIIKKTYLPGKGTSQTKALLSKQCLSAHPAPNLPLACTIQFSASLPSGSSGSHSEKGIGDPSTHTYRPSVKLSCRPIHASVILDSETNKRK